MTAKLLIPANLTSYPSLTGSLLSRTGALLDRTGALLVSLALIVGLRSPAGVLFVIPFGIHLGVCVNDWVVTYRALREPRGSLIEDVADGILIHPPPIMA